MKKIIFLAIVFTKLIFCAELTVNDFSWKESKESVIEKFKKANIEYFEDEDKTSIISTVDLGNFPVIFIIVFFENKIVRMLYTRNKGEKEKLISFVEWVIVAEELLRHRYSTPDITYTDETKIKNIFHRVWLNIDGKSNIHFITTKEEKKSFACIQYTDIDYYKKQTILETADLKKDFFEFFNKF